MSSDPYKRWPFEVLPPKKRSTFDAALIALYETAHAAGYLAYANETESVIGFGDTEHRAAEYVFRGGGVWRYWEPWVFDRGKHVRMGPLFKLSVNKCMVFDGIDDVATFTMRWLDGGPIEDALDGLPVFDRQDTSTPLKIGG